MNQNPVPSISERRAEITARVEKAASLRGIDPSLITLTAVSKVQPSDRIDDMLETGQRVFGENRVQEALERWGDRRVRFPDLELRLIGPLQTNKVEDALKLFDVIETIDRIKLAKRISETIQKTGISPKLFVQINTGEEEQKSGILPAQSDDFLNEVRSNLGLKITGLMCIPPLGEPAGPHFALLRKIAKRNGIDQLSMGMSSDFETAIAFGSTHIRVGSALFGERLSP